MNFQNEETATSMPQTPVPWMVLLWLLLATMLGTIVGSSLAYGWVAAQGMDFQTVVFSLNENSPLVQRNAVRMANLLNHVAAFTLPALLLGLILYRNRWIEYFKLDRFPSAILVFASLFFVIASFPFTQITYWLNKQIPLPTWSAQMEQATEGMLKGILVMNSPMELFFNLFVIAVVPAIGEELVFRGILQQQLERIFRRPALAIWVTAIIFSAIHLQFAGFLPRVVLGAALGYVFYWSRSLWVPILAHFLTNGLQIVAQYATGGALTKEETLQLDMSDWLLGIGSLILAVAVGRYLWRKGDEVKGS